MEFVEKALLRQIAYEKGILKEEMVELTHTNYKTKKVEDRILNIKGKVINHFLDRYGNITTVKEDKMLAAIKAVTNKRDDRTARNWLDLLLEKSLFRRVSGGNIAILELEQSAEVTNENRETICAEAKAEENFKTSFAGYPLVGDLH